MRSVVCVFLVAAVATMPTSAQQTTCAAIGNHSDACAARPECGWCYDRCYDKQTESCCNLPSAVPDCDGPTAEVCSDRQVCKTWNYTMGGCLYATCCARDERVCGNACYDPATHQCCEYPYPHPSVAPSNATCCQAEYQLAVSWCAAGSYCCGSLNTVCCRNGTTCDTDSWINTCQT
jgi:hypothetical protein